MFPKKGVCKIQKGKFGAPVNVILLFNTFYKWPLPVNVFELVLGVEAEGGDEVPYRLSDSLISRDCAIIFSCRNTKPNSNVLRTHQHIALQCQLSTLKNSAIF